MRKSLYKIFLQRWFRLSLIGILFTTACQATSLPDFSELVEDVGPAVVNISTTQKVQRPAGQPFGPQVPEGSPMDDFFKRFFGPNGPPGGGGGGSYEDATSLGSGFIISKDGYILTNHHVVDGADEIIVTLQDRRDLPATIVGSDELSDVALIKVEAEDLPIVKIGDPDELKVGNWVLAIGSPFGFEQSATAGIVSAKSRVLGAQQRYVPSLQTDVAINPGNSGGPLFNLDGEVVGINYIIVSRSGGYMGLSFAIPIDLAMSVADQLRETGRVARGWLGVLLQDVERDLAEGWGMELAMGAAVAKVVPDSPAADAGLKVGDVILEFDGDPVPDMSALPPMVGATPVNDTVDVMVLRNGERKQLKVTIGELPEGANGSQGASGGKKTGALGMQLGDLTDEMKERLDTELGAVVKRVDEGPARDAGLLMGDIVLKFRNEDVTSADQLKTMLESAKLGSSIPILVLRGDTPQWLALRIPAAD